MMGSGYYGMMGGWFGVILIPVIIIGVIVYAVMRLSKNNNNVRNERQYDNSLEILNERFARGEINEEEYKRKKDMLMKQ